MKLETLISFLTGRPVVKAGEVWFVERNNILTEIYITEANGKYVSYKVLGSSYEYKNERARELIWIEKRVLRVVK